MTTEYTPGEPDNHTWPDAAEPYEGESEQEYSDRMHRENNPHHIGDDEIGTDEDDDDAEMQMECPYCDGDGFWYGDGISGECGECGGTGWY